MVSSDCKIAVSSTCIMGIEPQMNQKLCSAILVNFWHGCLHVQRLPYSLHFSFLLNALIQDATNSGVLALLDNPQLFGHNLHRIINPRDFELKACACNKLRAVCFDCWFHNELGSRGCNNGEQEQGLLSTNKNL